MSAMTDVGTAWRLLGDPRPETLAESRLQLHRAAQIVSAFAHTHVEPKPGDSHTSLEWDRGLAALVGEPNSFEPRVRLALEPAALAVLILDVAGEELRRFALDGMTLDQAYGHVEAALGDLFGPDHSKQLERPVLDLGEGPGAGEAPFCRAPAAAFEELARWYADAHLLLVALAGELAGEMDVRCWPHHFDIAFLGTVRRGAGEPGTIGAGMTPGDDSYAVPYWYVTPYPVPDPPPTPELDGRGTWHTDEWFGAVLTAERLGRDDGAAAQASQVEAFIRSAVAAGRRMIADAPAD